MMIGLYPPDNVVQVTPIALKTPCYMQPVSYYKDAWKGSVNQHQLQQHGEGTMPNEKQSNTH